MSSRGRARPRQRAPAPGNAGRQQPAPRRGAAAPPAWPRLITEQYVPPAPRDLPELRGQLAAWLDGEAPKFYLTMALAGRQWVPPAASLAAGAAQVARQERLRVTGDLYWVSAPMTDLARHAAPRLPTRNLYAHDLPSRTGFMIFETPLAAYVNSEGREVQIVAVSWGPWDGPASRWDHGGIWLTFFSHPAPLFPRQAFTGGTADPAFLAPLIGTVPPVLPDNEAGWPFGELSDSGQLPDGTTAQWALTVRAGWPVNCTIQASLQRGSRTVRRVLTEDDQERLRQDLAEGHHGVPRVGTVITGAVPSLPYLVVDSSGDPVDPVSRYLRDRMLGDVSPLTCRSYAHDLLRWFRLLWLLEIAWDKATEAEAAALVGWLRAAVNPQRHRQAGSPQPGSVNLRTGKPEPGGGYAPATIAHALAVVAGFYDFHLHYGRGPLVNPVPQNSARRKALAHRSPLEPSRGHRRARLRPKIAPRTVRSIPDGLFEELFACMRSDRNRALLAFYVSSGARASELLGLGMEDIDWPGKRIWVISKGSRLRQAVPASPDGFIYLARYLDTAGPPAAGTPVWRTVRGKSRPLTYWAMRQVLERANTVLGTNWTLHDLRHTTAARLAADPEMTLVEVQTIMRHAHLSTTQLYMAPRLDDLMGKLADHYARPPTEPAWSVAYDPDDMKTVFGA